MAIDKVVVEEEFTDNEGNVGKTRVFHSGIRSELDDVQIAVASKKRFMEWYKRHTHSYPVRNHKGVVDAGKVIKMTEEGFSINNATFQVRDDHCEEFPFKMAVCDGFIIEMQELKSLKNLPRAVKVSAQYGSGLCPMLYMDTLHGGVTHAKTIIVHSLMNFLSLENSLLENVESIGITAKSFSSFEGLNIEVNHLTLVGWNQQSWKGIHRAFRPGQVNVLSVGMNESYQGGILPFAMMDPSITVMPVTVGSVNPSGEFMEAMGILIEARKDGANAHEIQELLIDAGHDKYARV